MRARRPSKRPSRRPSRPSGRPRGPRTPDEAQEPARLFVPGLASRAAMYRPAMPRGWTCLEPPSFRRTGGALAIMAAAERPERLERLVLVSPAGFPVAKSIPSGLADLGVAALHGRFRM